MKRTVITALVTVVSALACYAQSQYVSSTKGNVNLRTSPSTTAPKAGTLAAADLVTLIEEVEAPNGNWDDGKPMFQERWQRLSKPLSPRKCTTK